MSQPRVLILTLYTGESEYNACKDSVLQQSHTNWEHLTFEYLPNKIAHDVLYNTIMNQADEYDFFFKLDADMVLADEHILQAIVNQFQNDPSLDHCVIPVDDAMTGGKMLGAHAFSNRVHWEKNTERLFVDPDPDYTGLRCIVDNRIDAWIFHMSNPNEFQAFRFGVHRALKATQFFTPLSQKRWFTALTQWRNLRTILHKYKVDNQRIHALAMLGASDVFCKSISVSESGYDNDIVKKKFLHYNALSASEISTAMEEQWGFAAYIKAWLVILRPSMPIGTLLRWLK